MNCKRINKHIVALLFLGLIIGCFSCNPTYDVKATEMSDSTI